MNTLCHKYLNQNILPFVGRDHELSLLKQQFEEFVREGESRYTLISGEIGIGKSRLVKEFEEHLEQRFKDVAVVVRVRYLEGNAAALTPIINAFSAALAEHDNIGRLLKTLGLLDGREDARKNREDGDDLAASTGFGLQPASFAPSEPPPLQLLIDCFREIAKRFPLVLILEDIQNVEDFLTFEQFFLGLSSAAKYVIFSQRIGERGNTADRVAEQFVREIALREELTAEVMTIPPFGDPEILRLFHLLFVFEPSRELIASITEGSKGKPLNLRTMLRQLITTGLLNYDEGKWWEEKQLEKDLESEGKPLLEGPEDSGFSRFQRELERLNPDEQAVVTHAAWLGEQFDIGLLKRLMEHRLQENAPNEEIFQRVINLLTFKSIIRKATPSIYFTPRDHRSSSDNTPKSPIEASGQAVCYEFSHPHFWNTVVATTRHQIAGDHELILSIAALAFDEKLPLYSNAFLSLSGLPFVLTKSAGILQKVESFLCWASTVAQSLWAVEPQQSLRFLGTVKPLRDEVTWRFSPEVSESAIESLLDLHTMLVEALMRMGNQLEAERDLEHAAVLEKFISSRASQGEFSQSFQLLAKAKVTSLRAVVSMQRSAVPEFERWAETARQALGLLPATHIERARLLTMLTRSKAEWLLSTGRLKEADELIQDGLTTASVLAEARFDEYCLFYRLAVTSKLKQDQNRQAAELTQEIFTRAKERRDTLVETTFLFQAALAAFSTGDIITAVKYLEQGIIFGKRYGIRFVEMMSYLWRMIVAGVQNDSDRVKECSSQLESILTQTPNLLWRISLNEGRATTMNYLGRYTPSIEFAEMAIRLAEANHYPSFAAWAHNEKGLALLGLGKYDDAIEVAQTCLNLAGEQVMHERMARTVLASAWIGKGELERAELELERTRPLFREANPYYLRFLQAEAQLLKKQLSIAGINSLDRRKFREKLEKKVTEMYQLTHAWDASALAERSLEEFRDVLGIESFTAGKKAAPRDDNEKQEADQSQQATLRLLTFGPLTVLSLHDAAAHPSDVIDVEDARDRPGPSRSRDTKVRQLVSMLIAARIDKVPISRESLSDALWPESDAANSFSSLHTSMRRARAFLGHPDSVIQEAGSYQLSPIVSLDVEDVLRHFEDAKLARKRNAAFSVAYHYEQLLELTERGNFLEGIYGLWLEGARSRISSIRRTAATRLIQMDLERGLLDKAERVAHILLNEDEFDEEAIRTLLIVTGRKRQMSKAVTLYDSFARRLRAEFKVEPSEELKLLLERLKSGLSV